jgi:hypothetical protein
MPLAFESLSHGTIAFGFFNIETDMLLLDRYFFFASDFCRNIGLMAEYAEEYPYRNIWSVYFMSTPGDIGDLMGAIHGVRFTGFIGHIYRRFPFPQQPEKFKQNPDGFRTKTVVSEIIEAYAAPIEITVDISPDETDISIGDYRFTRNQFQGLIKYVLRGGYPRWKDEIKPGYVTGMKNKIRQNLRGLFRGLIPESGGGDSIDF